MTHHRAAVTPALALLLLLVLPAAGCGSDGDPEVLTDPSAGPSGTRSGTGPTKVPAPSDLPGGAGNPGAPDAAARVLDVVALPRGGGRVSEELTVLAGPGEQRAYVAGLAPPARADLRAALADAAVPAGLEPAAAVVAIGCEEPTATRLRLEGGRWLVAAELPDPRVECLVATTYVVLAGLPT